MRTFHNSLHLRKSANEQAILDEVVKIDYGKVCNLKKRNHRTCHFIFNSIVTFVFILICLLNFISIFSGKRKFTKSFSFVVYTFIASPFSLSLSLSLSLSPSLSLSLFLPLSLMFSLYIYICLRLYRQHDNDFRVSRNNAHTSVHQWC